MAGRMDCGALRLAGRAAGTTGATAMNCDPAELASLSRCHRLGGHWRRAWIYALCQWANNLYPCGAPSITIRIDGGATNGDYVKISPVYWSGPDIGPDEYYVMEPSGDGWDMIAYLFGVPNPYYHSSLDNFPCVWTLIPPFVDTIPTGQYV